MPWPFTARFAVSTADAAATNRILAVSICVAGRCYLDGKLAVAGANASYTVRLGATEPEGVGQNWSIRLDRLTNSTFADLTSERNARIANSTWGDQGTTLSKLNATPAASLTVTKSG